MKITKNSIKLKEGFPYSLAQWTNSFPVNNYEVKLKARRDDGYDIFCGILFPVGSSHCTMVLGGWSDTIVGLSCVDDMPAADNESAVILSFDNERWYNVRLKVTTKKIQAWIDDKLTIDQQRINRKFEPYPGLEDYAPFAFFTYSSSASISDISVTRIKK